MSFSTVCLYLRCRIWGRVEHGGPKEFVAIATAVPENGDPSEVRTLAQTLPSLQEAQQAARHLVIRMSEIVAMNEGRVTDVETDGI